jgi:ribosomal peptide maturation radical SAM protein 1
VVLVAMPWAKLEHPSIQLGVLQGVLEADGMRVEVRSLYLDFMSHLARETAHLTPPERVGTQDYGDIATNALIGDWIFSVPPFHESRELDRDSQAYFLARDVPARLLEKAATIRRLVPTFLEWCVDEILGLRPAVVGFTTTLGQNTASLVLSRMLKTRAPSLSVVFGGANCDGPMGSALHRAFPWIDVVVRGEGERVAPAVIADLLNGRTVRALPGLCYRKDGKSVAVDQDASAVVPMDRARAPTYDEYFSRLARAAFAPDIAAAVSIPFESSRGCWWGARSHCTFCGLNGSTMTFRSKPAQSVVDELEQQARRYEQLNFHAVDNILDMGYFASLMPRLRALRCDLRIFYETKANLRKDQIRALRDAGIREIQPGIESLSTPILKLIRKGVTAMQNIRLLKWCREHGIRVYWNLIYGFPGEPEQEYERMADVMTSLTHLEPPELVPLSVERFSPYHANPGRFGLEVLGPVAPYKAIYPCGDEYRHIDGRVPASYVGKVKRVIEEWRGAAAEGIGSLQLRQGPDFVLVEDRRPGLVHADYRLRGIEGEILLLCDGGATPAGVVEGLARGGCGSCDVRTVTGFLEELHSARLVYMEGGRYLSLAVPAQPGGARTRDARATPGEDT